MENVRNIDKSIVAGGNVVKSTNIIDNDCSNHNTILKQARIQSFWVSLVVGIVSSVIASIIIHFVI